MNENGQVGILSPSVDLSKKNISSDITLMMVCPIFGITAPSSKAPSAQVCKQF
jgi:hypothetical protein